jgi:hypothetical protein
MDGEVIFQNAEVESSKIDNVIIDARASTSCMELEMNAINV